MLDKEAPGDYSVAPGQTEATLFFIIDKMEALYDYCKEILGNTEENTKNWNINQDPAAAIQGGFKRTIPLSHPKMPNLYAQEVKVTLLSPDGQWKSEDITWSSEYFNTFDPNAVDYKSNPFTAKYAKAKLQVTFRALNYFVLSDEQMEELILQGEAIPPIYYFYIKQAAIQGVGAQRRLFFQPFRSAYYDFREYLRYTSMSIEPNNEIIVRQNGSLYFKTADNPPIGVRENNQTISNANGSAQFASIVTNRIKIKWFQIPKDILLNTIYQDYAGQVNYGPNFDQSPDDPNQRIKIFNWPMWNFEPGTLLYLGMRVEPSKVGAVWSVPYSSLNEATIFNPSFANNFVDVTFEFLQRVIPKDLIVQPDLQLMEPDRSGKMYTNGWNFAPFGDNRWRYLESFSQQRQRSQIPPYMSFPIQILFDIYNEPRQ